MGRDEQGLLVKRVNAMEMYVWCGWSSTSMKCSWVIAVHRWRAAPWNNTQQPLQQRTSLTVINSRRQGVTHTGQQRRVVPADHAKGAPCNSRGARGWGSPRVGPRGRVYTCAFTYPHYQPLPAPATRATHEQHELQAATVCLPSNVVSAVRPSKAPGAAEARRTSKEPSSPLNTRVL